MRRMLPGQPGEELAEPGVKEGLRALRSKDTAVKGLRSEES